MNLQEVYNEDLMKKLEAMAANGELTTDEINTLTFNLKKALRTHQVSKRTPDSYKAAAEKAKSTRIQNVKDTEASVKSLNNRIAAGSAAEKARQSQGLLPTRLNLDSDIEDTVPNIRKYYDQKPSSDGFSIQYILRSKYRDTPVGDVEQFWSYTKPNMNEMKTQLNEVRRMQKLAGILKEEDMGYAEDSSETIDKAQIGKTIKAWGVKHVADGTDVYGETITDNIPEELKPSGMFNEKMDQSLIQLSKDYHTGMLSIEQAIDKAIEIVTDPSNYGGAQLNEDLSYAAQKALADGDYVRITPATKVIVGKNVLSLTGIFGEIAKIEGDKYKIKDDDGYDSRVMNRQKLEKHYLIQK